MIQYLIAAASVAVALGCALWAREEARGGNRPEAMVWGVLAVCVLILGASVLA